MRLSPLDVPEILKIYQSVFDSFAAGPYMAEKLAQGRGRAFGIKHEDELIAVAQSDYESDQFALIVGVATLKEYQGKSIGRACFQFLCSELVKEGKTLHLQYDSPIAGELYKSTGFINYERVFHVSRGEC